MDADREDKVQLLLQEQIEHAEKINDYIGQCECKADCHYHEIYISHQQLTKILLEEMEQLYMSTMDAKFYLSDFRFLRDEVISGIMQGINDKTLENLQKAAKTNGETEKNTNNRRGGVRLS